METNPLSPVELADINSKLDRLLQEGMTGKNNDILTNEQVCQKLKLSSKTLKSYRDRGMISFSKIGKKIYYQSQDVDEMIHEFKQKKFKNFRRPAFTGPINYMKKKQGGANEN